VVSWNIDLLQRDMPCGLVAGRARRAANASQASVSNFLRGQYQTNQMARKLAVALGKTRSGIYGRPTMTRRERWRQIGAAASLAGAVAALYALVPVGDPCNICEQMYPAWLCVLLGCW